MARRMMTSDSIFLREYLAGCPRPTNEYGLLESRVAAAHIDRKEEVRVFQSTDTVSKREHRELLRVGASLYDRIEAPDMDLNSVERKNENLREDD